MDFFAASVDATVVAVANDAGDADVAAAGCTAGLS